MHSLVGGPQGRREILPLEGSLFFPGEGLCCGCPITSESNRLESEGLAKMLVDLGSFFRMSSLEQVDGADTEGSLFLGVRGLISMRGGGGRLSGGSSSRSTDLMTCTGCLNSC